MLRGYLMSILKTCSSFAGGSECVGSATNHAPVRGGESSLSAKREGLPCGGIGSRSAMVVVEVASIAVGPAISFGQTYGVANRHADNERRVIAAKARLPRKID